MTGSCHDALRDLAKIMLLAPMPATKTGKFQKIDVPISEAPNSNCCDILQLPERVVLESRMRES